MAPRESGVALGERGARGDDEKTGKEFHTFPPTL
jgi:hypothetical protein